MRLTRVSFGSVLAALLVLHCFAAGTSRQSRSRNGHGGRLLEAHRRLQDINTVYLLGFPSPYSSVGALGAIASGTSQLLGRYRSALLSDSSLAVYADCLSAGPFLSSPLFYPSNIPKPSFPQTGYLSYIIPLSAKTETKCQKGLDCSVTVHGQGLSYAAATGQQDRAWLFGPVTFTANSGAAEKILGVSAGTQTIVDPCGDNAKAQPSSGLTEYSFFNATAPSPDYLNAEVFSIPLATINGLTAGSSYILCWASFANFNATQSAARNTSQFTLAAQIVTIADFGPSPPVTDFATSRRFQCYANKACDIGFSATFATTFRTAGTAGTAGTTVAKLYNFGTTAPAAGADYCGALTGTITWLVVGGSADITFTAIDSPTDSKWTYTLPANAITLATGTDYAFIGICVKTGDTAWAKAAGFIHYFTRTYRPIVASSVTVPTGGMVAGSFYLPYPAIQGSYIAAADGGLFGTDKPRVEGGNNFPSMTTCSLAGECTVKIVTGQTGATVPAFLIYDYSQSATAVNARIDCGSAGTNTALGTAGTGSPMYFTGSLTAAQATAGSIFVKTVAAFENGILQLTLDNTYGRAGRDYRVCIAKANAAVTNYNDFVLAHFITFTGATASLNPINYSKNPTAMSAVSVTSATAGSRAASSAAARALDNSDAVVLKTGNCVTGTPVTGSMVYSTLNTDATPVTNAASVPFTLSLATLETLNLSPTSGTAYAICYQDRFTHSAGELTAALGGGTPVAAFFTQVGQLTYWSGAYNVLNTFVQPTGTGWNWQTLPSNQVVCSNATACTPVLVQATAPTLSTRTGAAQFYVAKFLKTDGTIGSCSTSGDVVGAPFEIAKTGDSSALATASNVETLTITIPATVTAVFEIGAWKYQLCFKNGASAADSAGPVQSVEIIHTITPNMTTCSSRDFLTSPSGYAPLPSTLATNVATYISGASNTGVLKNTKVKVTSTTNPTIAGTSSAVAVKLSVSTLLAAAVAFLLA